MARSKRHHYVPQFLLKNFLGSEKNAKIEIFDKRTGKYREQAIREVAHECGYNHITIGDGTLNGENMSQVFDDLGSTALRPVIEQRSLGLPIKQDRHTISQFIVYQLLRGPTAEANITEAHDKMLSLVQMMPDCEDKSEQLAEMNESDSHQEHLIFSLTRCSKLAPHLLNKIWFLSETTLEKPFWISDCPVTMHRYGASSMPAGLGTPFTEVSMPLSSTLWLRILSPEILSALVHNADWCRTIGRGVPIKSALHNTEFQYETQLRWANRFVYAKQFDRDLIDKLVSHDPSILKSVE